MFAAATLRQTVSEGHVRLKCAELGTIFFTVLNCLSHSALLCSIERIPSITAEIRPNFKSPSAPLSCGNANAAIANRAKCTMLAFPRRHDTAKLCSILPYKDLEGISCALYSTPLPTTTPCTEAQQRT